MSAGDDHYENIQRRLASGERYAICNECGARLWSEDAPDGTTSDRDMPCPYSHDQSLAERMGCATKKY